MCFDANIFYLSPPIKIDQWGEHAKWKIDLVLLDNPQQQQQSASNNNSLHPLLSPQHLHPNVITTPSNQHSNSNDGINSKNSHTGDSSTTTLSLPVTSTIQYPVSFLQKFFTIM